MIMRKTTFNDDALFKKKNTIPSVLTSKKNEPLKKDIFGGDDQEEEISLTKPIKKVPSKQPAAEVKAVQVKKIEEKSVEVKPAQVRVEVKTTVEAKPSNPLGEVSSSKSPLVKKESKTEVV